MASGRWVSILDPAVLKSGMKFKSCLDMDHVNYEEDDSGDERPLWFDGKIAQIKDTTERHGLVQVDVHRNDHDGGLWHIVLTQDNLEFFKIWVINEWDE